MAVLYWIDWDNTHENIASGGVQEEFDTMRVVGNYISHRICSSRPKKPRVTSYDAPDG